MSSTGLPTRLVSRAARLGCSSDLTASRSASRSFSVISEVSCNDNSFLQHVCSFPIAKTYPSYGQARNNGRALWRCRVVGPFLHVGHARRIHGLRPPTAESRCPSPQLSEMPAGALLSWSSGFLAPRGESRNRSFRSAARYCQQPTRRSFGTAARCTRSAVRAFVLHRFGAIRH